MTQDAKLGHMLDVAVCTGQEEGEEIITMTLQGKERSSKYKDDVTFLLCSYIQRIGLQR